MTFQVGRAGSGLIYSFGILLVAIFLIGVIPAASLTTAAKKMSVEQLEQFIAANKGLKDHSLAEKLGQVELTEQLSEARLATDAATLPGDESREVLTALADIAEFQPLPKSDAVADAAPDAATTNAIFKSALNYTMAMMKGQPNFSATRLTDRYEYTPLFQATANEKIIDEPLHKVGSSTVTLLYNNTHEKIDAKTINYKGNDNETSNLNSEAEFGKILVKVLGDALKGTVRFDHWQTIAGTKTAVFAYTVPQAASRFGVAEPWIEHPTTVTPAYHGEIAIKPADGTILRLTVVAEMGPKDLVMAQNLLVDYGEVSIGAKQYVCPVKSVSLIVLHMQHNAMLDFQNGANWAYEQVQSLGPGQTHLNVMRFSDFK